MSGKPTNIYFGVFNKDPVAIAKSIPRPKTPINFHKSFVVNSIDKMKVNYDLK